MATPFKKLRELADTHNRRIQETQDGINAAQSQFNAMLLNIRLDWLLRALDALGIAYPKPEGDKPEVVVGEILFSISDNPNVFVHSTSSLATDLSRKTPSIHDVLAYEYGQPFELFLTHTNLMALPEKYHKTLRVLFDPQNVEVAAAAMVSAIEGLEVDYTRAAAKESQIQERASLELRFREEVAARFEVSPEAFQYLVDLLADRVWQAIQSRDDYRW